jgi:Mlc titration factor MtfA (ptsG expression regulator)
MQKVYVLYYIRDITIAAENKKRIGTYSSYKLAKKAENRVKDLTGFIDYPNEFYIDEYVIDKDYWADGFKAMQKVYVLYHIRDIIIADENEKRIGTYTSYKLAQEAKNRVKDRPGFIDYPDDFYISEYVIDKDYWVDGFKEKQKVYFLYHIRYEDTDDEDVKIVGIYSSAKQAKLAIERVKNKPGFINFPDGFQIIKGVLNRDGWCEGFIK